MDLGILETQSTNASSKRMRMVGIADFALSADPQELLVAPNLGSCIGLTIYDPIRKVGGVVHCLLPLSKDDPIAASENPAKYVDTGVVFLLNELIKLGAQKSNLRIIAVGGSTINDKNGVFEIGKKNVMVLRKVLWKNSLLIHAEDLGGETFRTVSLSIETGIVSVRDVNGTRELGGAL
jgi:chemotaxis protein CheD